MQVVAARDLHAAVAQRLDDDGHGALDTASTRIGLAPASTARSPSRTIAWASTVAVVVPSPTTPLVFIATSLTSWAPMLANGSRSWISLAIVTPSLVIVGGPVNFSRMALRPFGPSVTLTASASALTPCSSGAAPPS